MEHKRVPSSGTDALPSKAADRRKLDELASLLYVDLRRLARQRLRGEDPALGPQTTSLVHEAYIRLARTQHLDIQDRGHLLALAAKTMRRILVDLARARRKQKRSGGVNATSLQESLVVSDPRNAELVAIDDALSALAAMDTRKAEVVELRFFGGLDEDEIAQALGVSVDTVQRDWKAARAWLSRELSC